MNKCWILPTNIIQQFDTQRRLPFAQESKSFLCEHFRPLDHRHLIFAFFVYFSEPFPREIHPVLVKAEPAEEEGESRFFEVSEHVPLTKIGAAVIDDFKLLNVNVLQVGFVLGSFVGKDWER